MRLICRARRQRPGADPVVGASWQLPRGGRAEPGSPLLAAEPQAPGRGSPRRQGGGAQSSGRRTLGRALCLLEPRFLIGGNNPVPPTCIERGRKEKWKCFESRCQELCKWSSFPVSRQVCPRRGGGARRGHLFRQGVPGTLGSWEAEMKRDQEQRYDLS